MIQYGKRIIFDKQTGNVLNCCLEEMSGDLQEGLRPIEIDFIDIPFGSSIFKNAEKYHIDVSKDKTITPLEQLIIIDSILPTPPPSCEELQQQLLAAQGVI